MTVAALVTGAGSGLGRFAAERLGAIPFTRASSVDSFRGRHFELIVHAAFNRCGNAAGDGMARIVRDNLILTEQLLTLEYRTFVFISSIDVYPATGSRHHEDEAIDPAAIRGLYGLTKFMAESLVRTGAPRHIILRPGLLIGDYMRPNSVSRILAESGPVELTLSAGSTFYLVGYLDVLDLIQELLDRGKTGTFNVVRSRAVSLGEVAEAGGRQPRFGAYRYDSGEIANEKAAALVPRLAEPSIALLRRHFGL
jgi:nucleoside-diphosphate-sugar epimerase